MINLKNVSYAYHKKRPVLSTINLEIKAGHIYGLLGENGAGKSTLLKMIGGMVFPQTGEVDVMGHCPAERTPEFLSQLFFIPEEFTLPPVKIAKYLDTYAQFYKDFNEELFYKLVKDFDIEATAHLDQLSFGQKKKVFIAFGLATQTRLLLMDEPTNGLDIPSKSQFRKVIASVLTEDRCIIISTHQVRDLDNLIDALIMINKERIALNASMDEIGRCLSFKVLKETNEKVIYGEQSLSGIQAILPNTEQEDTRIDIELFFKGMLLKETELLELLTPTTIHHEQHV